MRLLNKLIGQKMMANDESRRVSESESLCLAAGEDAMLMITARLKAAGLSYIEGMFPVDMRTTHAHDPKVKTGVWIIYDSGDVEIQNNAGEWTSVDPLVAAEVALTLIKE